MRMKYNERNHFKAKKNGRSILLARIEQGRGPKRLRFHPLEGRLAPRGSISECIFMCSHVRSTSILFTILFSCKDILCGFWEDVWGALLNQGDP